MDAILQPIVAGLAISTAVCGMKNFGRYLKASISGARWVQDEG
jgi:hypothetical protein